jgi:FMN phosphatase YigB (HAD superfamily)
VAVSVALFGTLLEADAPADPAAAVAAAPRERGVDVPPDLPAAYGETHAEALDGAAVPRQAHVAAALSSRRGDVPPDNAARRAVVDAFDPEGTRRPGARAALGAAADRGPVAGCSNCVLPERASLALRRAGLRGAVDGVVTAVSAECRIPDMRNFETVARRLVVQVADLVHVGTDPGTDGGVEAADGRFLDANGRPLTAVAADQEVTP